MKSNKIAFFRKVILGMMLGVSFSGLCQTGIGNQDPKATLHISAKPTDATAVDGVILPRLTGNELKAKDGIYGANQTGAMVYVTAAASPTTTKTANVTAAGNYYFDGSVWVKSLANAQVSYRTVSGLYPTSPSKGDLVYTTSSGTAAGTIFRIETYDGLGYVLDKGVYPYNTALSYPAEVIVTKDDQLYQSNGLMAANTAFVLGTTGATWRQIGTFAIPNWTDGGAITIGATTTAPTKPTTTVADKVYYKQIGPKTWEVEGVISWTSATGSSAGSGDYLITLPNGLQFDNTILTQAIYTGNVGVNSNIFIAKGLPKSNVTMYDNYNYFNTAPSQIIPWDASRFRLVFYISGSGIKPWGSNWIHMDSLRTMELRFNFTFQSAN